MTGAMVEGWLAAGMAPATFTLYNPNPKPTPAQMPLLTVWPDGPFDAVLLGMKPQILQEAAPHIDRLCSDGAVVLSILGGIDCNTLARTLPSADTFVRFMPNLAVAIGKSPNALFGKNLNETQYASVTALAEALGTAEWLADETQFNLVTALAGSGPGFVYRVIDALAQAGVRLGLDAGQAERLTVQMTEGAAALAAGSAHSPGELARRVASPGGMTQAGLDVLDANAALVDLFTETLRATRDRGAEMAREAAKQG